MNLNLERSQILIGEDGLKTLQSKRILIVGLGGVGSFAAEAIARAGVGSMTIIDHDRIAPSNCNRQLIALHSTIGRLKADVMAERLLDINPDLTLVSKDTFITPDNCQTLFEPNSPHFLLDCIDSIACKAALVAASQQHNTPVISALGAGGRLDVTRVTITQLKDTAGCPLAREMRKRLRQLEASLEYPVVFSDEPPIKALAHRPIEGEHSGRSRAVNGSSSYLPALFGMMMAGFTLQALLSNK